MDDNKTYKIFLKLFETHDVSIKSEPKRIDGDFKIRYTWRIDDGEEQHEGRWEGFVTAKGMINNMVGYALKNGLVDFKN